MPGIVGLITKSPCSEAKSQLSTMLKTVQHEDFYNSGTLADESLGVYVGWTAIAGSFGDGMPVNNEKGDITLVFSGDEYSDLQIANELRTRGHEIGQADAAYLVHLYEEDQQFVQNLNGMFHGLVIDRMRGMVNLFNDRFGMHKLHFYQSESGFYFATEAKAILAVHPELRNWDLKSLGEFIACSCVLEDRTMFKGIHTLPAASSWNFQKGQVISKTTYFSPAAWEQQEPLQQSAYCEELGSVLSNVLPRYFSGRQRMGIAMTGGLDTRVILACHPPAPGSLPGYTFGSKYRETYDVQIGRQIAKLSQQSHQVIEAGNEFLRHFGEYAERTMWITEGTVDLYRASDLYLSEKVREIAPAKIVGTYGSEIVRRAVMFKPVEPPVGLFGSEIQPYISEASNTYARLRRQHPVTFAAFRQSPWYHQGILALEQSQLTVRSPFMDNDFVRAVYRAPRGNEPDKDVRLCLIQRARPALGRIRSDRGIGGEGPALARQLVHAFREFTFKAEYAYDYGMPQSLVKIDRLISWMHPERLFFGRHKLLHFRTWYRDELAEYVRQILLDQRAMTRQFIQKNAVESMVKDHLNGTRNNTTGIHKLLSLELFGRLFLDAK